MTAGGCGGPGQQPRPAPPAPGGAPPPVATRGRRRPCSPRSAVPEADVTGSRRGHGHKGGFVGPRGPRARHGTKRPGPGSAPWRRGGRRGERVGPGPASAHLPVPPKPGGWGVPRRWQEKRGCSRPPRRKEMNAPRPRPAGPPGLSCYPCPRAEADRQEQVPPPNLHPCPPSRSGRTRSPRRAGRRGPQQRGLPAGSGRRSRFRSSLGAGGPCTEGPLRAGIICLAHPAPPPGGPRRVWPRSPCPAWQWSWVGSWQAGPPWVQPSTPTCLWPSCPCSHSWGTRLHCPSAGGAAPQRLPVAGSWETPSHGGGRLGHPRCPVPQ